MFKSKFYLTNALDINKYRLVVSNKVLFTMPDINIKIIDGGEDTNYTLTTDIGTKLESIYSSYIRGFILSYDNTYVKKILDQHTLDLDIANENLTIVGDKDKFNKLTTRLSEFDIDNSELNKLMQALYKFISHKNTLLIDLSDVEIKKEDSKLSLIFSANDDLEPSRHSFKYTLGKTTGTLNWTETVSNKINSVEEDISLYIAKIDFKKVEKEFKDLFELEDLVIDQPDLGDVARQLSDMNLLVQSFLTISSSPTSVNSATAFRYSYDNGVSLRISEDEDLFIGKQFGHIILINNRTKSQTQINIGDETKWNQLNRPEIKNPITSIFYLYNMITLKPPYERFSNNRVDSLFTRLLYIASHYRSLWIIDHGTNKSSIKLRNSYAFTFEYIDDNSYKVIYKTEGMEDDNGKVFTLEFTFDGMLRLDFKKENEVLETTYITLSSLNKIRKTLSEVEFVNDLEKFRERLNILIKYK